MARTRRCNDYLPEELIFNILLRLPVKSVVRFQSVCKLWLCIISGLYRSGSMARTRRCNKNLPEELIFNILSRLPVKSLVRYKSVCKLWLCKISRTSFVRTHMAAHKKQAGLLNYMENNKYIELHDHQDIVRLYLPSRVTGISYINSCDGLVCLSNFDTSVIYIWNPLTKQFKLLPTPNKQLSAGWHVHIGLGFDPISSDYKLLRIVFRKFPGITYPPEADLYSANANSWKSIEIPNALLKSFWPCNSKLVHAKTGVLYLESDRELLAFDLHSEVFQLYSFPKFGHYNVQSNVLDFEGNVAMIFQSNDGSLALYILDDACEKVSWTKMFYLETDLKIDWVAHYLGTGEFVGINNVGRYSFSYNYKKRETKKVNFNHRSGTRCAVKYTESLVSLPGFEQARMKWRQQSGYSFYLLL